MFRPHGGRTQGGRERERERLFVVGDSLALDAEPHLRRELPEWQIHTQAQNGMETAAGLGLIASAPAADATVVSLGTNDDPADVPAFAAAVERVLADAGSGAVVWPAIVSPPAGGITFDAFNRVLADASRSDARLVVVDWPALARANPGWLKDDGIHATRAGDAGRAEAIAEAVRSSGKSARCWK